MSDAPWLRPSAGILRPVAAEANFDIRRYAPDSRLKAWVDYHWVVRWDRAGRAPFRQETLPHPAVNLVFERGRSGIFGPTRGKSVNVLAGCGWAFATKFRPSGFSAFFKGSLSLLADRCWPLERLWQLEAADLLEAVLGGGPDDRAVQTQVEAFLAARGPQLDPDASLTDDLIRTIAKDRRLLRVEHLAQHTGLKSRTLQRLFNRYVGLSPKLVIRRYRLQEAAQRLAQDPGVDGAVLAHDLGYFDQAHFIHDFKDLIGVTPSEYARQA